MKVCKVYKMMRKTGLCLVGLLLLAGSFSNLHADEPATQIEVGANQPAEVASQVQPEKENKAVDESSAVQEVQGHPAAGKEDDVVVLNFGDANLMDIIRTIGEITGENFMLAPGVSGKITIQTAKPVHKKDVFAIFESILEVNGLSAVKTGSYYKILQSSSAKQRSIEIRGAKDLESVPPGDSLITQIIPIEFVSANDIVPVLQPMISPAGSIYNYSKANTLILTDISSNIRKALDIIKLLDVDAFKRMEIAVIPVASVEIKTLHKELSDVLSALGLGKDPGQLALIPIERLNSLIVFSSNDELLVSVKEWIARLDQSNSTGVSTHIYYVQNDKASNIKTILDQLIGGKSSAASTVEPQPSASSTSTANAQPKYDGNAGAGMKIHLYEPTNALIIQSSQSDYQNILRTIKELDQPPKQVLIDAFIAEVKLDETTKYGIQWSVLSGNANIQQNTGLVSSTLADPRSAISTPIGVSAPAGLSVFATDASRFFGVIQAMASVGKLNVLSNPHIVVKNYEKASINIGSDEPIATQSTQTAVTGTSGLIQNIEYRKTGVILTVTPHITEGGMVSMNIRQEVSDKSTDRTVGSAVYPSFTKREAETSVVAKDASTLVIGGLIQEKKDDSSSGIPFLSKIPLLGHLFKYTTYTEGKTELVIMITPRIIGNPEQAATVSDEMKAKLGGLKELLSKRTVYSK